MKVFFIRSILWDSAEFLLKIDVYKRQGLYCAESDGSEGPDPVRKRRYELPADDFI